MTLNSDLEQVRAEYLRRITSGDGPLLQHIGQYVASRSGKMLRPRMLLAAAATLNTPPNTRTILLAVAVEMLHNASLLHDDVIDFADNRRGQPSVNARWGNAAAVLVGDHLLARIMQLLNEVDEPAAARRINATVTAMVESELFVLDRGSLNNLTADEYLNVIDGKTARLFATAAALGNPDYEEYGLHYGRLFQLCDDRRDGEATPWTDELIAREEAALHTLADQGHTLDMPMPYDMQ